MAGTLRKKKITLLHIRVTFIEHPCCANKNLVGSRAVSHNTLSRKNPGLAARVVLMRFALLFHAFDFHQRHRIAPIALGWIQGPAADAVYARMHVHKTLRRRRVVVGIATGWAGDEGAIFGIHLAARIVGHRLNAGCAVFLRLHAADWDTVSKMNWL